MSLLTAKNFATGHFDVMIDGKRITSFIKSVDGGLMKATSTEEARGPYHLRDRHLSTREVSPLVIEMGAAGGSWALKALEDFLRKGTHTRYNGQIAHGDMNMKEQYVYEFTRALITEIALFKCDAKAKDFATIKITLQPEDIEFRMQEGPKLPQSPIAKQKLWTTSAFRLRLHGIEASTEQAVSVEALTFKMGAKAYQAGGFKLPEYHPTKLEMPKLGFTIPMKFAGPAVEWYRRAVCKEGNVADPDSAYELNGGLEILDQARRNTIYELELKNVGPETFTIEKSEANKDTTKLCKFEAYISDVSVVKNTFGLL